eukprot:CAMPEP_0114555040 /NCGR_PEP_ID=MMETSP0114-20121206/8535_1 /TAXON_ID=31324 /ORGANISM="Goniomonas sp, Strain m" /LENGTH=183 /DNA_ID=CAMNT_0001740135 /DNA_START=42 /DNA_END=590 /DNA_ORIENTATION=+
MARATQQANSPQGLSERMFGSVQTPPTVHSSDHRWDLPGSWDMMRRKEQLEVRPCARPKHRPPALDEDHGEPKFSWSSVTSPKHGHNYGSPIMLANKMDRTSYCNMISDLVATPSPNFLDLNCTTDCAFCTLQCGVVGERELAQLETGKSSPCHRCILGSEPSPAACAQAPWWMPTSSGIASW